MVAEQSDIRRLIFKYRSYTPIPFLIIMVWFAQPTVVSMVVGAAIIVVGELLRFWGVSIAGSETRTTGKVGGTYLITNGPFAYVRNPLYVGNMLMYAGVGVMSMALFPWLLLVALLWFYGQYYLIVTQEEEYLAERFGEVYQDYRRGVGRFIPKLKPYVSPSPPPKLVSTSEGLASERRTLQAVALVILLIVAKYAYLHWQA
ncbi:MAG TPA: isoprenylcysteine carboxylmethyltransferase family protein [Bacteroidetes bacterium]|jgi:protein-S-isoprenylcysteine O-methyltransferase Ste14|nr:isoprenylcysteine carboxylmethyltransferase family protein [Bacteroidota bacterium]